MRNRTVGINIRVTVIEKKKVTMFVGYPSGTTPIYQYHRHHRHHRHGRTQTDVFAPCGCTYTRYREG